jgi:pyruvate,water dikinase
MTMADMQEKATGAFVFDRAYVASSYQAVAHGIKKIIDNLNVLADGKYESLIVPHEKNDEAVRNRLAARLSIPKTDYVLTLAKLGKGAIASASGKLAHLGELANAIGLPVPAGWLAKTIVGPIRSGKTGYGWAIDDSGNFLYHLEKEFIG